MPQEPNDLDIAKWVGGFMNELAEFTMAEPALRRRLVDFFAKVISRDFPERIYLQWRGRPRAPQRAFGRIAPCRLIHWIRAEGHCPDQPDQNGIDGISVHRRICQVKPHQNAAGSTSDS